MTEQNNKQLLLIIGKNFQRELILQLYDVENDEWYPEKRLSKEILPECVDDSIFCSIGRKIYFMTTNKNENRKKELCSFDLVTNEISRFQWDYKVDVWKMTVVGHCIYFYDVTKDLWYYDTSTKIAQICTRLKDLHCPYGIQNVNGIVYVIGTSKLGWQDSSESYNPATKEVKYIASLPICQIKTKGHYIRNTSLNGKLYVINSDSLEKIFVFSPEENAWKIIDVKNNPPFFHNGKLTACNGFLIGCNFKCWVYIYLFDSNNWECRKHYRGTIIDGKAVLAVDKFILYHQCEDEI